MREVKQPLRSAPFHLDDMIRGEDGEFYHLPTLRALHAAGCLAREGAGYALLMGRMLQTMRLIA